MLLDYIVNVMNYKICFGVNEGMIIHGALEGAKLFEISAA